MPEQEIEWNLNQGFAILILKLIDEVNMASKIGDLEWFTAMRTLFINIEGIKRVNQEQAAQIDKLMIEVSEKLNQPEPKSEQGKIVQKTVLRNIKRDLDMINRGLMRLINQAELIKFHIDREPGKSVLK